MYAVVAACQDVRSSEIVNYCCPLEHARLYCIGGAEKTRGERVRLSGAGLVCRL